MTMRALGFVETQFREHPVRDFRSSLALCFSRCFQAELSLALLLKMVPLANEHLKEVKVERHVERLSSVEAQCVHGCVERGRVYDWVDGRLVRAELHVERPKTSCALLRWIITRFDFRQQLIASALQNFVNASAASIVPAKLQATDKSRSKPRRNGASGPANRFQYIRSRGCAENDHDNVENAVCPIQFATSGRVVKRASEHIETDFAARIGRDHLRRRRAYFFSGTGFELGTFGTGSWLIGLGGRRGPTELSWWFGGLSSIGRRSSINLSLPQNRRLIFTRARHFFGGGGGGGGGVGARRGPTDVSGVGLGAIRGPTLSWILIGAGGRFSVICIHPRACQSGRERLRATQSEQKHRAPKRVESVLGWAI